MSNQQQLITALQYMRAIMETVHEGEGAPSGHIYTAMMTRMNIDTYESLITKLIDAKAIRRSSDHFLSVGIKYHAVLNNINQAIGVQQ